jgi:hypothetical protein
MIKLFSLKQQKKDDPGAGGARANPGHKQATAAQLRVTKGMVKQLFKCKKTISLTYLLSTIELLSLNDRAFNDF